MTRRRFSAEEKLHIVLEGRRGEASIAALCRPVPTGRHSRKPQQQRVQRIPGGGSETSGRRLPPAMKPPPARGVQRSEGGDGRPVIGTAPIQKNMLGAGVWGRQRKLWLESCDTMLMVHLCAANYCPQNEIENPMTVRDLLPIFLVLAILVSGFLRPSGTMLVFDGKTFTYEICTGGDMKTVTIRLDGKTQEERNIGCDFFAAQIGAMPLGAPLASPTAVERARFVSMLAVHLHIRRTTNASNAPRAPPLVG